MVEALVRQGGLVHVTGAGAPLPCCLGPQALPKLDRLLTCAPTARFSPRRGGRRRSAARGGAGGALAKGLWNPIGQGRIQRLRALPGVGAGLTDLPGQLLHGEDAVPELLLVLRSQHVREIVHHAASGCRAARRAQSRRRAPDRFPCRAT